MKRWWAWALVLACGCYTPVDKVTLRVELPAEAALRHQELQVLPRIAEIRREARRGVVVLELKRAARRVRLSLPDACPTTVELPELPEREPRTVTLAPLFDLGPDERVVGVDQPFELRAVPRCREARESRSQFSVSGGALLLDVTFPDQRTLTARTGKTLPELSGAPGVVAVSAREQRALRSEITFTATLPDGQRFRRVLGVSPLARSSGLSDIGTGHPVLLNGAGWQLQHKPADSQAALQLLPGSAQLVPDLPGRYELGGPDGQQLTLHSGRYDRTPLDCGRADCHAEIAQSAAQSPMTKVLASDLGGCHSLDNPACATACHTTGEPGTPDGGFHQVQRALGLGALPEEHDELPPALQRLGGVGCLACHGPSKIPAPDQRLALLRSDVCAVCHDAPPRYGHVQALQASRMGHADSSPAVRQNPSCARCHTAWGALGRKAPAHDEAAGITCATCHDVHPHGPGHDPSAVEAAPSLLRLLPLPDTLPDLPASLTGVSRVCVGCHAPTSNSLRPEASAAALVAGQGGLDPRSGAPLVLSGPHTAAPKGCLSCHDSGPEPLVLGKSHAFRATGAACQRCHQAEPQRDPTLFSRARQLLQRLDPERSSGSVDRPWHARYELALSTAQQTRALRNVLLVLEDPAADVHHPGYAKALLDASERFLNGSQP